VVVIIYGISVNVPLLLTSTLYPGTPLHIISFTKLSPTLVLQATNTGVRRPGYLAIKIVHDQEDTPVKQLKILLPPPLLPRPL